MIPGDPVSVGLSAQLIAGIQCIVLRLIINGVCIACRWETDANQYQVAAALRRLADRLEGKI